MSIHLPIKHICCYVVVIIVTVVIDSDDDVNVLLEFTNYFINSYFFFRAVQAHLVSMANLETLEELAHLENLYD